MPIGTTELKINLGFTFIYLPVQRNHSKHYNNWLLMGWYLGFHVVPNRDTIRMSTNLPLSQTHCSVTNASWCRVVNFYQFCSVIFLVQLPVLLYSLPIWAIWQQLSLCLRSLESPNLHCFCSTNLILQFILPYISILFISRIKLRCSHNFEPVGIQS